ncbi:SAM-dependent methyltransferase [Streptomyces sp. NPDC001920]
MRDRWSRPLGSVRAGRGDRAPADDRTPHPAPRTPHPAPRTPGRTPRPRQEVPPSGGAEGGSAYAEADPRDPVAVLDAPAFRGTRDPGEPVALTAIAVVHVPLDEHDAVGLVRRPLDPLPGGRSCPVTSAGADSAPDAAGRVAREYAARGVPMRTRDPAGAENFFTGLDLVGPGAVQTRT